ncbi:MAG: MarR family transcriptional regulator [Tissierellia bacterium]|nr:MarR family transcriptional regulator [Tissierellia bacterium]
MNKAIENIKYDLIKFMSLFHRLFTPVFKREVDNRYNCTKNQVRAIMIIGRSKKISPTILGKCMDMEKGSITSLIDALESMNLVYRENDLEDKRKTWIQLTKEGEAYYYKQEENFIKQLENTLKPLSDEEIIKFSTNLSSLVKIMEKVRDSQ